MRDIQKCSTIDRQMARRLRLTNEWMNEYTVVEAYKHAWTARWVENGYYIVSLKLTTHLSFVMDLKIYKYYSSMRKWKRESWPMKRNLQGALELGLRYRLSCTTCKRLIRDEEGLCVELWYHRSLFHISDIEKTDTVQMKFRLVLRLQIDR